MKGMYWRRPLACQSRQQLAGIGGARTPCASNRTDHPIPARTCFEVLHYTLRNFFNFIWSGGCLSSPFVGDARPSASPPRVHVSIDLGHWWGVKHGANAAPEVSVDELARLFPSEVLVVQSIVSVEYHQIFGEFFWRGKVLDVDERVAGRTADVVFRPGTHHNRKDVPTESIDKKLLGDVVLAVRILKCQIELVLLVQHAEAPIGLRPGTSLASARAVDVHGDVLGELAGVLESLVPRRAVGNEPCHSLGLVLGVVVLGDTFLRLPRRRRFLVGHELLVRCHDVRVVSVGRRPIENVRQTRETLRVQRTLQEEEQPDLTRRSSVFGPRETVFEEDGVGALRLPYGGGQFATTDGTVVLLKDRPTHG